MTDMAWTDDELREAIHEAAVAADGRSISIVHSYSYSLGSVAAYEVDDFRHLLTALGIDHQPKPELPDTPGSVIYDAMDSNGNAYPVMTLDKYGKWCGVDQDGFDAGMLPSSITSFGGVLDLDKVRGEQGE